MLYTIEDMEKCWNNAYRYFLHENNMPIPGNGIKDAPIPQTFNMFIQYLDNMKNIENNIIYIKDYILLIDKTAEEKEIINIGDYFLGKDLNGEYDFVGKCFNKTYDNDTYFCWTDDEKIGGFAHKYKILKYYTLTDNAKTLEGVELINFPI